MADNPLLPQSRLRELHALMHRVRQMDRRQQHGVAREALIAATLLHVGLGDLLSAPAGDRSLRTLAPSPAGNIASHELPAYLRLPLCAGAARGMLTAGTDRLAVAFAEAATPETGWADALAWAQRDQLPFLLVCTDVQPAPRRRANGQTQLLAWAALTQLARKIRLPVFPVDGQDAVAVYRVVQEATARGRARGGPAVLWAVLQSGRLPRREQPLARLEAYMTAASR